MNVTWHDSNFAFIWFNNSWTVGSDHSGHRLRSESIFNSDHIMLRNTISNGDNKFKLSFNSFNDSGSSKRRGNINNGSLASSFFFGLSAIFENWKAKVGATCFFRIDSSYHLSFIIKSLLGLESSFFSSNTLTDHFSVFINPDMGFSGAEKFGKLFS